MIREVYKAGQYRVVFSVEEHRAALAEGWSDEKPITHFERVAEVNPSATVNPEPESAKRRGRPPMNRTPEAA